MSRFSDILFERDRLRRDIEIGSERLRNLQDRLDLLDGILEFAQADLPLIQDRQPPVLKKAA